VSYVFEESESGDLRFVGDFDGLYRAEADPWGQSGDGGELASYYRLSRDRLSEAVGRLYTGGKLKGIEIGCGHGFALQRLAEAVGGHWSGMDIAPSAVMRARLLHPNLTFYAGSITGPLPMPPSSVGYFDVAILSQLLWYVIDKIDEAVLNAARLTKVGGLVIVSQAFLKGEQRYGADIADGFRGTLALFLARFPALELIEARYDDGNEHAHHDGLMIFRKTRHAQ
jgi:SAM-dependent methyltransferase